MSSLRCLTFRFCNLDRENHLKFQLHGDCGCVKLISVYSLNSQTLNPGFRTAVFFTLVPEIG